MHNYSLFSTSLSDLNPNKKLLITTLNAHSYNVAKDDSSFKEVLLKSDVLIPDGVSVVWALRFLTGKIIKKIAGADLFFYEMERLQKSGGKCFFLGSSNHTLSLIMARLRIEYPNVRADVWSPPYKPTFSEDDNQEMMNRVNAFNPAVLFVGMTAPKQEKWSYQFKEQLNVGHICCIGAVFDFYAGTVNRAPKWMIGIGMEWFYRLIKEPKRMWRRYLIGNSKFIFYIIKEKIGVL